MVGLLGLRLYSLGNRRPSPKGPEPPPRPAGQLVWLHAPTDDQLGAICALARRLVGHEGFAVLITGPETLSPRDGVLTAPCPADTTAEAKAFLDYWRPDLGVFSDGELRPVLLALAKDRNIPLMMVNARAPRFLRDRDGWYPGLMRSALVGFAHILAVDEGAARLFRKAGASLSAVAVTGRSEEDSIVLPDLEPERATLAALLATRPVWFAAGLPPAEEAIVLGAHRSAMQHSHRLLLILAPDDPTRASALAQRLEQVEGWAVAERAREQEPEPQVEVFVVDNPSEYGLWYRLAPVTFLGGSLIGQGPTRDPIEAAALGSAIIHGPKAGRFGRVLARLGAARATRAVATDANLAEALGDLIAPDRAARLAQAAWAVASEGAEVTELVLGRIRSLIDGVR